MAKGEFSIPVRRAMRERAERYDGNYRCECARAHSHPTDGAPANLYPGSWSSGPRCSRRVQEAHHVNQKGTSPLHTCDGLSNCQGLCEECHSFVHYGHE
jgi:hypothetical protein